MYHAIGSQAEGDRQGRYSVAPKIFAEQMHWLAENCPNRLIPIDACLTGASGVAVTFDDGYADNIEHAAPVLLKLAIPFTVFVTRSYVCSGKRQYLSCKSLRDLAEMPGATIGAHGDTHRRLTECDDRSLADELGGTRTWLEDTLGVAVSTLSYPHGACDERVMRAAAAHGYRLAASSRFGLNEKPYDHLALKRTDIWSDDEKRFPQKMAGAWDWLGWRSN